VKDHDMMHMGTGRSRLGITVAALALLAGCTDMTLSEPGVKAPEDAEVRKPVAEQPAAPASASVTEAPVQTTPAQAPAATQPFAFEAPARGDIPPATCQFDGFALPANAKVYAAGAYGGKEADFQIDQSGHQATTIQVAVHEPNAPVVLLLGAYEPTVWSVGWTRGTRIAAVLVTGYHRQQLTGLPANVPLLVSTYDNRGPCGYAYVGGEGSSKLNPLAREVFGRAVDVAYPARDGRAVIGTLPPGAALVTDAAATPVKEFQLKGVPPAGQAGIDAALRDGTLRPATPADLRAWEAARQRNQGAPDIPRIEGGDTERSTELPYRSYTVRKAFNIPAGLYGAHSATFFVAPGVPVPTGNPGHSQVRLIEDGSCSGPTCGMR
jgi:hypothetical protein